jgi:[acyl-carrier-protein] S-malonyltransferase
MRYAVLFPGQGSQYVGMGADVFAARSDLLGQSTCDELGWSLQELCAEGPEGELMRTDRAQVAMFAVSYALWEAFAEQMPHPPVAGAGHSLGEYTALAAAGAIDYCEGLRLVAARGAAMAAVGAQNAGTMAAVMGSDLETIEAVVAELRAAGRALWVANVNAPGQVVIAGGSDDVAALAEHGRELGLRRVVPLKVAGAFHTPLMAGAQASLDEALGRESFTTPSFPIWTNLHAAPAVDIPATLSGQLVGRVRFSDSLLAMNRAGAAAFVHIGPGDVTAGMAKRTVKGATVITVSSLEAIGPAVERLAVV